MRTALLSSLILLSAPAALAQDAARPALTPPPAAIQQQIIQPKAKAQRVQLGGFFGRMDSNRDGTVTHDEAVAHLDIMFKKADLNRDNALSASEVTSWNNQRAALAAPRETK